MSDRLYCAETQHLIIAGAKGAGLNADGSIQFTERDVGAGEMAGLGLRPLALLALVVPAYRLYYRRIVDLESNVSVSSFLHGAWSESAGIGLPLTLELREHLAGLDRGFIEWLRGTGVSLVLVPKANKAHVAFEKVAAAIEEYECKWGARSEGNSHSMTLREANLRLQSYDVFNRSFNLRSSMVALNREAFLDRQKRFSISQPRESDCSLRELTLHRIAKPDQAFLPGCGETFHYAPRGLKELIEQWPGGKKRLLEQAQVRWEAVRWWLDDRAHIHSAARHELFRLLRVELDEYFDDGCRYEMTGGYLIHAKSRRAILALYDELSHGGDLRMSFEVLPPTGDTPAQRVLIFANYGDEANVVVFPNEGWVSDVLNRRSLINFTGAVRAPREVWEDVKALVLHGAEFKDPSIKGAALERAHAPWFQLQEETQC